jgi:4-hydroxy-3-methylbut-2-enyl diphosphate reductase
LSLKNKTILLCSPRGYCAGVENALQLVDNALKNYGTPLYILHEIVHNTFVVDSLKKQGITFVETIRDVPNGSCIIFSAHGVSPQIEQESINKELTIIDATCPLVKKVHRKANRLQEKGIEVILIGHKSHPEVIGTLGELNGNAIIIETVEDVEGLPFSNKPFAYLTQTTLSDSDVSDIIIALKQKLPNLSGRDDICYATTHRQQAVRKAAKQADYLIIVGSQKSSNSNRLCEIGNEYNIPSILIDSASEIPVEILDKYPTIALSAGASAPECLVEEVIKLLNKYGWNKIKKC